LYVGITNGIRRRLYQHRYGEVDGFAKRYHLNRSSGSNTLAT
jgi:predicted GIY-YIG superfamily endonuclease